MRDREPVISTARACAQLKQKIREATCEHPRDALRIVFLSHDGWIEYCTCCNKIVDMWEAQ